MFPARLRLGLSATPERADGKELLVFAHIGPVRVKAELQLIVPKVLRYVSPWRCPRRVVTKDGDRRVERVPHEPGRTTFMEKILAKSPERNLMLGSMLFTAFQKGRRTVLFSSLHDHLHLVRDAAREMGIKPRDMGLYIGAGTKAERELR